MEGKKPSGASFLRKSSSGGVLKRSSSIEILTWLTPTSTSSVPQKAPAQTKTAAATLPTQEESPSLADAATVLSTPPTQKKSTSTDDIVERDSSELPTSTLSASTSTPSFNTSISMGPLDETNLSPIKSKSSGGLDKSKHGKNATPKSPFSKQRRASTPLTQPPASRGAVRKPLNEEKGSISKVTTEPAAKSPPIERKVTDSSRPNPLAQRRRKRSDSVPSYCSDDEVDHPHSAPVWQKRLSQLFVPPSERELFKEEPADQPTPATPEQEEETSQLLPRLSPRPFLKRGQDEKKSVVIRKDLGLNKGGATGDDKFNNKLNNNNNNNSNNNNNRREQEAENEEDKEPEKDKEEAAKGKIVKSNNRINFEDEIILNKGKKKRRSFDENTDRLSELEHLERKGQDSSDGFSATSEEDNDEDEFRDGYTSWDDTICSNRSSYFKMYYSQRGVIGPNRIDDKAKASRASSQNSLSSLIRERMGRPQLPAASKTRADLGLMILVAVLFVIIVVGISLTSYFYNLHLLEMTIFNSIKFFEKSRVLEIFNPQWESVATAHLGSNLPFESIPEDCTHYLHYLHKHNHTMPNDGYDHVNYKEFVCLDWSSLARLQLRKMHAEGDVQCYSVWWVAAREDFTLRDCLQVGEDFGTWWGGGEMSDGGYPVTNANVPLSYMVTGKLGIDSWGKLLRRSWMSERASLLTLPDSFQGFVSVNHNGDKQVCVESRPHPHLKSPTPTLEYSLCTAPNISSLSHFMHKKAIDSRKIVVEFSKNHVSHGISNKGHTEVNDSSDIETQIDSSHDLSEIFDADVENRVKERIDQPVWVPWMRPEQPELTQEAVLEYVDSIVSQDYGSWGHILLPPSWQARPGELIFDSKRFPDPAVMVDTLEKKGFRLALTIHPFVSVNAAAFNSGAQEGLWVRQSKSKLPALVQYNDVHPCAVTDFSNPKAKEWFSSRLKLLQNKYKIDRFHLQPANAHALPAFHEYHLPLPGPDSALVHFMASVSSISAPMSSEGAIMPPLPPTFITLGHTDGSWQGLETLIPRILTLTTLGYPLIDIGITGGKTEPGNVPERELYIRWMEAAAFLPSLQVNVLPRMYGEEVKNLTLEYNKLRKDLVLPRLHSRIPDALQNGAPLMLPLALYDPNDSEAAQVKDQWILGRDLLVAPITHRGKRSRNIYLPDGIWEDGIDKHLRRGKRWIRNYKVPLTKIPYFVKKPMDDYYS